MVILYFIVKCTWGSWTNCTKDDGNGNFYRTRGIEVSAKDGGKECTGQSKQECGKSKVH